MGFWHTPGEMKPTMNFRKLMVLLAGAVALAAAMVVIGPARPAWPGLCAVEAFGVVCVMSRERLY